MKKLSLAFAFCMLCFFCFHQVLVANSIIGENMVKTEKHGNDSLLKRCVLSFHVGYNLSPPQKISMPQSSGIADFYGDEKKLSFYPQMGLSSRYKLFDNKMEIGLGLVFSSAMQIFETDSALINEFIADGYNPDEKYRETEKFIIHGNNLSAQLELAYYFVPKLAIQLDVNRSLILFSNIKRELYSEEKIVEKYTITNGDNLPEYIPYYYDRMTYSLSLFTSVSLSAGSKMSLKPGIRVDFQGLSSSKAFCLSSVGVFLKFDLNK